MLLRTLTFLGCAALISACSNPLVEQVLPGNGATKTVEVEGHPELKQALVEELARQRKNNRRLNALSNRRRVSNLEIQLIRQRLRAEGYYRSHIENLRSETETLYSVVPGPQYSVREVQLELPDNVIKVDRRNIDLNRGDALLAEAVLSAREALAQSVKRNNCLREVSVRYEVTVFHPTENADVLFVVAPSPQAAFGEVDILGLTSLEVDYVRDRLPFEPGTCFKTSELDQARLDLLKSNLIQTANTNIGDKTGGSGTENDPAVLPITLELSERPHKTLSAGVGFSSDEGPGVSLGWEHRNLLGRAEKLEFGTQISELRRGIFTRYTVPHWRREQQTLTLTGATLSQRTDAFDSEEGRFGIEITRQVPYELQGSVGVRLEILQVDEKEMDVDKDEFALVSIPIGLARDRRNDTFDPRQGWVASAQWRPFWDLLNTGTTFYKSLVSASGYHTFDFFNRPTTLAIRTAVGSIEGAERADIPANVRFFSGGGGSVRGYPFQSLGPLDEDNEPLGGLSFTEVSIELRARINGNWGLTAFADGGTAFAKDFPNYGRDLRWGAGLGLRYYTSFAPIRFDVAAPLDRRPQIDDSFQVYVSIGQAF